MKKNTQNSNPAAAANSLERSMNAIAAKMRRATTIYRAAVNTTAAAGLTFSLFIWGDILFNMNVITAPTEPHTIAWIISAAAIGTAFFCWIYYKKWLQMYKDILEECKNAQ
jgi:hypothetical protein